MNCGWDLCVVCWIRVYSVLKCGAGSCVVCDMCGLLDACVVWLMCGVGEMCVVCEV